MELASSFEVKSRYHEPLPLPSTLKSAIAGEYVGSHHHFVNQI